MAGARLDPGSVRRVRSVRGRRWRSKEMWSIVSDLCEKKKFERNLVCPLKRFEYFTRTRHKRIEDNSPHIFLSAVVL